MELTAENVDNTVRDSLLNDEEVASLDIEDREALKTNESLVVVEGVVGTYVFNKERLMTHRDDIYSMVQDLPNEFRISGGGGWSFLNLCERKDGVQWTGDHRTQEALCVTAIGTGLAQWLLPRELWSALAGEMPYIAFDVEEE